MKRLQFNRSGIWFPYKGDELCLLWPWHWKDGRKYISTLLSGNGEFGDAMFRSLKEYRDFEL